MSEYSTERKEAILKKLLPPHNLTLAELSRQEGVSKSALYEWRLKLKHEGKAVPGKTSSTDNWSAEAKVAVVVETATLSESALSEYCRSKGLYPEQVVAWKQACIAGQVSAHKQNKQETEQIRQDKKRIEQLEGELNRKDKALAEAATLLVLQKKFQSLYGAGEEK
jgi:transposase-like protein